ncbi:MAG: type IX secretion system membrane protein PorP/SprF [Saprospiraceae bacterium]|nr:type IX secretion system membrane protein PorP/SprF [Saprospiraceae bacterium]
MRKFRLLLFLWGIIWSVAVLAQQVPMLTNYHFNSLVFNPAYAGSNEHLTLNLSHRQQWLGFDGAPVTQTVTAHSPLRNERVGVGLSLSNDKIGPGGSTDMGASYAYRMQVGASKKLKLSLGLQASVANWRGKFSEITVEHSDDPSFSQNQSRWLPNFGAGAYLYGEKFYLGLGCPHILEHDLRKTKNDTEGIFAKNYRSLYLTTGAAFPLQGDQLVFRPSLLVQSAGFLSDVKKEVAGQNVGAPMSANLGAAVLFRQLFWVGTSYRTTFSGKSSHDSANLWFAWSLRNGMRFGASYDITLSKLRNASSNSFEIILGYEFDVKVKQVASPRYF